VPCKWLPTELEIKPALDALWPQTRLIPDLNTIIAGYADLEPPRWPAGPQPQAAQLVRPFGELRRRFRFQWRQCAHQYSCLLRLTYHIDFLVFDTETRSVFGCKQFAFSDDVAAPVFDVDITPTGPESGVLTVRMNSEVVFRNDCSQLALCRFWSCNAECFDWLSA
jgi:hypothetical protein